MFWATVSSWSCFCWLYRASPSLAAKNIINLISLLTIWWCPCVEFSLVLLEEGVCYDQCDPLTNSISLCPASFCTQRPNLPVTPGISWHPTFAFQSPMLFFLLLSYQWAESDQLLWELPALLFLTGPTAWHLGQILHNMHLFPNSISCFLFICVMFLFSSFFVAKFTAV